VADEGSCGDGFEDEFSEAKRGTGRLAWCVSVLKRRRKVSLKDDHYYE
jgi:hypothetical protein